MEIFNFQGDSSSAVSAVNQILQALNAQNVKLEELATKSIKYNEAGEEVSRVVKLQIDSMRELEVVLNRDGRAYETLIAQARNTTNEIRRQADEQKRIFQQQKDAQTSALSQGIAPTIGINSSLPSDTQNKLRDLQRKISETAVKGGLGEAETRKIFDDLKAGIGSVEVGVKGKLQTAFQRVLEIQRKSTEELEKQAKLNGTTTAKTTVEGQIRGNFPVPTDASVAQLLKYETNLNKVLQSVTSGKLTVDEFNKVLSTVQNKTPLAGFNEEQLKVAQSLESIRTTFSRIAEVGRSAALSFRNFLNIGQALLFKEALSAVTNQFVQAIGAAAKFQIGIAEIRTISQESQSTFQQWGDEITRVSTKLGLSLHDVTEATYETLSNQTTKGAAATGKFVETAGEFARVTVSSTTDAVNLLTSAMNAYKLPVEDAERISGIFFKTIDLGRVRANEMANTFGRVGSTAAALGISLEETAASVTVLTRQGVKFSDASTQITNVMLKLIKPTKEMQELLNSWGTPTGEAAIATFGFSGVLNKLEEASKGSLAELSHLFNELRGLRGAGNLTTRGLFDEFTKDLDKIKNAGSQYDIAKILRAEPAADQLKKEFNEVKNFFINELGQGALKVAKDVSDAFKSFDDGFKSLTGLSTGFDSLGGAIKQFTIILIRGVTVYATYKVATLAASLATTAYTTITSLFIRTKVAETAAVTTAAAAQLGAAAATDATAVATTRLLGLSAATWFGLVAAGAYLLYTQLKGVKEKTDDLGDAGRHLADEQLSKTVVSSQSATQKEIEKFNKSLAGAFSKQFLDQSVTIKTILNDLESVKEAGKEISTSLSTSFKDFTDKISQGVRQYSQDIEKAKTAIKSAEKTVTSFGDTVDKILFDVRTKYATEAQKIGLDQQQINNLQGKAQGLFDTGKIEDYQEGVKLIHEIASLEKKVFEARTDYQLRANQNRVTQSLKDEGVASPFFGQGQVNNDPGSANFGKQQFQVRVSTNPLEQRLLELKQKLTEEESKFADRQKNVIIDKGKELELEKERLRLAERAGKAVVEFSAFDKGGKLKPEFANKVTGKADPDKIQKGYEKAQEALKDLVKPIEGEDTVKLFADLEKKKTQVYKEALLERRLLDAQDKQRETQNSQTALGKTFNDAANQKQRSINTIFEKGGAFDKIIADAEAVEKIPQTFGKQDGFELLNTGNTAQNRRTQIAESDTVTTQRRFLQQLKVEAEAAVKDGKSIGELTLILERAKAAYFNLEKAAAGYAKARNPDQKGDFKDILIPGFEKERVTTGVAGENARAQFGIIQEQIQKAIDAEQTKNNTNDAVSSGNAVNAVTTITGRFNELAPATDALTKQFQDSLKQMQQGQGSNIPAPNILNPFNLPGYAEGGLVEGPSGHDSILARLTRNEFVMPTGPTQQFLPELLAMRNGIRPFFSNGGSTNSTIVGDINISVQGPMTPDKTIRDIGHALRREIRRGNVFLQGE